MKDSETEGLSEEERAALEDTDDNDTEALKKVASDEDDDEFGADVTDEDKDTKGAKGADEDKGEKSEEDEDAKAKAGEEGAGDEEGGEEEEEEQTAASDAFTPLLNVQQPENFDERMTELNSKEEELDQKFENDDIKWADYRKQQRQIHSDQRTLQKEKDDADFAEQQNDTISRQRWLWEVDRFVQDTADIDYRGDEAMRKQLDTAVRVVAQSEEASSMSGRQILEEADKWVRARNNLTATPAGDKDKDKQTDEQKKNAAVKGRKPDLSVVPETLAKVPAAAENETGKENAKFAELDRLAEKDGMAYENALAALPKHEQDEYLASTG